MNAMRWLVSILVCAGLLWAAGCSTKKSGTGTTAGAKGATNTVSAARNKEKNVVVTPAVGVSGKVVSVNQAGQFVVLSFQNGVMPVTDQKLSVYRGTLKVGEVKMSKEQIGQNQVADIVAGEARVGDETRPD